MKKLCIAFLLLIYNNIYSQSPATYTSADIYNGIKKLNVLGSVLYIAAHPDDENTRLLAYLAKEKQYRTGYLSLTRGDGGQNLIGDEQGVELGLIRTQELLAARRMDGAEQFFSSAYDFGFSKTADETFEKWDKEKILSDVVWIIRKFQPDVIVTRFPGDSRAGHGHHWASALLANEAFEAAADPNRFTEQFKYGVQPWKAKRILWNVFTFGGNPIPPDAFKTDVGIYNNLLGKSYGEIASESRSNHKSQGFGVARTRGESFEYFVLTGGDKTNADIMEGVTTSWSRIQQSVISDKIESVLKQYNFEQPQLSVKPLVELYRNIKQLPDSYWKNQKLKEVQQLIEAASGIFAEATTNTANVVQGDSIKIQLSINKRNDIHGGIKKIITEGFDSLIQQSLATNKNLNFSISLPVAADKKTTQPYWLEHNLPNGRFDIRDQHLIGKAENDAAFAVQFLVTIEGEDFIITKPVQYKFTDPVKGELYQPLSVLPKVEVKFEKDNYVSMNGNTLEATVKFKTNGKLTAENYTSVIHNSEKWNTGTTSFTASTTNTFKTQFSPKDKQHNTTENITVTANKDVQYAGFTKTISYDHIPTITWFPPAKANLVHLNIKTVGKNIGYITGAGDKIPEALQQMGFNVVTLGKDDITNEKLNQFDAVITGIRAYNVHEFLTEKFDILMNYVQKGGNLIVQYNTNNQIGPIKARISPYTLNISRTRVTEEDAAVTFTTPQHPALNYPNKITNADFEGWIQERSVYEADKFDSSFVTPLMMHDKNEKPGNGSLLIAAYGKGNFVYTGLSFFRQLPAGVPGAYRLFANLIALPKHK